MYSPQSSSDTDAREIDFEIGYGTAIARADNGIQNGKLMCYMTVQRDDSSGTAYNSAVTQLDPDSWYTFKQVLTTDSLNNYKVSWMIRKGNGAEYPGRSDYICKYGSGNTSFFIMNSVENFSTHWIGENQPVLDKEAYFDYVSFRTTTHPITVTQGINGTITPAGAEGVATVNDGADQKFNITPNAVVGFLWTGYSDS